MTPTTPAGPEPQEPGPAAQKPTEPPSVRFTAYGRPITQGSIRSLGKGRPSIHGNAATLLPWRQTVAYAARDAMQGRPPFTGPVGVVLWFHFNKPASAPKRRTIWPITRSSGDLDKLCRAAFDAITDAGVWGDDSQVIALEARKCWTHEQVPSPCVEVAVRQVAA